jgi:hypothetical protein
VVALRRLDAGGLTRTVMWRYGADTMADLCEAVIVAEADAREAPLAALAAKAKADGCKCLTPDVLSKLTEVMEDGNKKKVQLSQKPP